MSPSSQPFWNPAEPFSKAATEQDVFNCFCLLLGRYPYPEEWPGHSALAGNDLQSVVRSYVTSREFAEHELVAAKRSRNLTLTQASGFAIYTDTDDLAVGKYVAAGVYEPELAALLRQTLRPGMGVLDLGANIGFFTMLAASLVGREGYVLAVEPNLANVRMLEASRKQNGFTQVALAACAIGAASGVLALDTAFSNIRTGPVSDVAADIIETHIVPCFPLPQLVPPDRRIDFIKIDVEGAEHLVLAASRDLLLRWRPVIASEFSPELLRANSGVTGLEYLEFFAGLGYRAAVLGQETSATNETPSDIMRAYERADGDHIDIVFTPNPRPWWRKIL